MIDFTKNTIKKYDRSVVVVLTALGVIMTIYFSVQKNFDLLVRSTSIIKELQETNAVQKEINRVFDRSLERIDQKLDRLLSRNFK